MRITAIKEQEKNKSRASIYADDLYRFSLTKDQLAQHGLKVGQEISEADIENYKSESDFGKLRDLVYKWLSIRSRSEWEVTDYLKRKTKDEALQIKTLNLIKDQGYINDGTFAGMWIRSRSALKPMSKRRLKQELIQKRVPMEVIDGELDEAKLDDVVAARELIAKRGRRYPDRQKLMAYLARQGFDYGTIKAALEPESDENA